MPSTYEHRKQARATAPRASPLRKTTSQRSIRSRKISSPDELPRNKIPPVTAKLARRIKKNRHLEKGSEQFNGRHDRTALRRLIKKSFSLVTLANIDHRTDAYKLFRGIVKGITADLGGEDRLTTLEGSLIQGYASAHVRMIDLTARQLVGDELTDFAELTSAISSLVRIANRLGVQRRPREVTPLSSYLNSNGNSKSEDVVDAEVIDAE